MKKLVFEFEIDNLQPEDEIEASDVYGLMYQRFPLSLVSVRAVEHSVQADEFSGHANNCVLWSGVYACTCGAAETTRR